MATNKYSTSKQESESDILPNKLGLSTLHEIEKAEMEGFYVAYKLLFEELNSRTKFNLKYIFKIHKIALGHLYTFAGKPRTVNMSKGGFLFPPAKFMNETLNQFEADILLKLPKAYVSKEDLIKDIAVVHAELLFIHPFREGNGRASRLLATLMAAKAGYNLVGLEKFSKDNFDKYVAAVQQAIDKKYDKMISIISSLF
ncbi:MAG: cell filamentation protein Fic [Bacteroidetes bacterium]|nr:cell filamentation protein Fic [Bacteroidota bacterium]